MALIRRSGIRGTGSLPISNVPNTIPNSNDPIVSGVRPTISVTANPSTWKPGQSLTTRSTWVTPEGVALPITWHRFPDGTLQSNETGESQWQYANRGLGGGLPVYTSENFFGAGKGLVYTGQNGYKPFTNGKLSGPGVTFTGDVFKSIMKNPQAKEVFASGDERSTIALLEGGFAGLNKFIADETHRKAHDAYIANARNNQEQYQLNREKRGLVRTAGPITVNGVQSYGSTAAGVKAKNKIRFAAAPTTLSGFKVGTKTINTFDPKSLKKL